MEQQAHKGFDAVWIAGAWKAVVHGRMQKPDFKSKGAALAFADPASRGLRREEPIEGFIWLAADEQTRLLQQHLQQVVTLDQALQTAVDAARKLTISGNLYDHKLGLMRIELREIAQNLSKQISKKGA